MTTTKSTHTPGPDAQVTRDMVQFLRNIVKLRGTIDIDDVNTGHNASFRALARALLARIEAK